MNSKPSDPERGSCDASRRGFIKGAVMATSACALKSWGSPAPEALSDGSIRRADEAAVHLAYFDPAEGPVPNPGMGVNGYVLTDHMHVGYTGAEWNRTQGLPPRPLDRATFERMLELPSVDNLYLRFEWRDVQKQRGKLDLPDAWKWVLEAAEKHGKRWSFRIMNCSPHSMAENGVPDFLQGRLKMIPYWHADNVPGPRPKFFPEYDNDYLNWWGEFVALMGAEFDAHPLLEYVDVSGYGFWGEMHHFARYTADGSMTNYQPGSPQQVEAIVDRLISDHLKAFPKTPAVLGLHAADYSAGLRAFEQGLCWPRRDSFQSNFSTAETRLAQGLKPGSAMLWETILPGIHCPSDTQMSQPETLALPQRYFDIGAHYIAMGFNPWAHEHCRGTCQILEQRIGYRLRPSMVWLRRIGNNKNEIVLGLRNDGCSAPPGQITIQARFPDGSERSLAQSTFITRNLDDSINSISYGNTAVPTPNVRFKYDPNYSRVVSMTDGIGTTTYNYLPVTAPPVLGAGRLASVVGPLTNDTVTYVYEGLGRPVQTAINGVTSARMFDVTGRITGVSNALGTFTYAYDGSSDRLVSQDDPNGEKAAITYGNDIQDFALQQISYASAATPISEFTYGHDIHKMQITTWSQQAGAQSPFVFTFDYDAVNQLLSAVVTNSGVRVNDFAYSYDPAGNRLTEQAGGVTKTATYNALNQLSTAAGAAVNSRTNEWDAQNRLTAVNAGNLRTEFAYDGLSRLAYIRQLQNGSEISFRRFVWSGGRICEERDATGGNVTKRFYGQGMKLETGPSAGVYYYTRDHLGSIRELTDAAGNVRARYSYDPYGRRTKVSGDVDADFGFVGMFWSSEASLALTHFRAYDPELGRWLSRDPLGGAERKQGPNLYAYVRNQPVNHFDAEGLCAGTLCLCGREPGLCAALLTAGQQVGQHMDQIESAVVPTLENCEAAATEVIDVVLPALEAVIPDVESFPGIEISEGVVLTGNNLEQWLLDEGEIGGELPWDGMLNPLRTLGPNATDLLSQSMSYEDLFLAANQYLPAAIRLEVAAQFAAEKMGFDVYRWLP